MRASKKPGLRKDSEKGSVTDRRTDRQTEGQIKRLSETNTSGLLFIKAGTKHAALDALSLKNLLSSG